MRKRLAVVGFALAVASVTLVAQTKVFSPTKPRGAVASQTQRSEYFPDRFDWQHRKPEDVGMRSAQIDQAVQAAIAAETRGPKDMVQFLTNSFGKEPFFSLIGPVKDRGPASGLITRHGYIVAEWGEPLRADITNSVTKTFLTTVVGLAWQKGLIHDVNDYVRDYMPPHVDLFESEHNRKIKWDHLLRQTSDWQGTLWDRPDWADRPQPPNGTLEEQKNRKLWEPGTHFKYNDVRVNVMSLAALQVIRRPLPEVLREEIMEQIGASSTWRWYGYENSWVDLDGKKMQSVSGGGHWGGGLFISSYDMARFGYLMLRNGRWKDRQIVSDKWIAMARTPGTDNKEYGYANWYLNLPRDNGGKPLSNAPEGAVRFVGNGSNIIYVDWQNDIVAVFRWIQNDRALDDVIGKIAASMKTTTTAAQ
ncbi:MAG TPA: serine hydrolase [Vicinamibacterales bacterium]|nr:serine hydrolase [Vicinamibacterales bacterium]